MELSKRLYEEAKFKTKGRWYNSDQVDTFIDRMFVEIKGLEREAEVLRRQTEDAGQQDASAEMTALRDENARLQAELEKVKKEAAITVSVKSIEHQRKVCEELEKERDELIENIKLLRRFREEFRQAVKRDAEAIVQRVDGLDSVELL